MKSLKTLCVVLLLLVIASAMVFATGKQEGKAKAELSFYWALYEGMRDEYREDLQSAFNAANPEYNLTVVPVDWDKLWDKLTTSLAAGNPPDMSIIGTRWLLDLMDMDAVVEVTPYVSQATLDNIAPGAMEAKIGGKLMGLPFAAGSRFMAYNADITTTVPATMEELREAAIAATTKDTYGMIMVGGKHTELTDFCYYFYAAGGEFFDADGKSAVASPAGIKALEFMVKLANEDKVVQDGFLSQDRHAAHPVFFAGKTGYVMIGAWADKSHQDAAAAWPIQYCQIPPFEGNDPAPLIITDSIALFKASKNLEGIGKFIDFFYQDEWKAVLDKDIGFPPVTISASARPEFQTPMYAAMAEANLSAKGWPLVAGWAEVGSTIWDAVQKAYLGQASPARALKAAAKTIDGIMAE